MCGFEKKYVYNFNVKNGFIISESHINIGLDACPVYPVEKKWDKM